MNLNNFTELCLAARDKLKDKLSVGELGQAAGISTRQASRLINGNVSSPPLNNLIKMLKRAGYKLIVLIERI